MSEEKQKEEGNPGGNENRVEEKKDGGEGV